MWEQGDRRFNLQSASVVESEVNALVSAAMLTGNLAARGDFDSLPIPFRAVATDLATGKPVVLRSGDLAQAVRASVAIPLVFAPELRDSQFLADGGLSANIPVAVARAEGAERVIVSDATEHPDTTFDGYSPIDVADRLIEFLFQQPTDSLSTGDVLVRPDVDGFNSLNFSPRTRRAAPGERPSGRGQRRCRDSPALARQRVAAARSPAPAHHRLHRRGANDSERLALERMLGPRPQRHRGRRPAAIAGARAGRRPMPTMPCGWTRTARATRCASTSRSGARPGGSSPSASGTTTSSAATSGPASWIAGYSGWRSREAAPLFLDAFRKELYTGFRRKFQIARQLVDPDADGPARHRRRSPVR